jgi:hypothetical protein
MHILTICCVKWSPNLTKYGNTLLAYLWTRSTSFHTKKTTNLKNINTGFYNKLKFQQILWSIISTIFKSKILNTSFYGVSNKFIFSTIVIFDVTLNKSCFHTTRTNKYTIHIRNRPSVKVLSTMTAPKLSGILILQTRACLVLIQSHWNGSCNCFSDLSRALSDTSFDYKVAIIIEIVLIFLVFSLQTPWERKNNNHKPLICYSYKNGAWFNHI